VKGLDDSWRKVITDIFEDYKDRTPGSEIENKTINITWHYRSVMPCPNFGPLQSYNLFNTGMQTRTTEIG